MHSIANKIELRKVNYLGGGVTGVIDISDADEKPSRVCLEGSHHGRDLSKKTCDKKTELQMRTVHRHRSFKLDSCRQPCMYGTGKTDVTEERDVCQFEMIKEKESKCDF